MHRNLGEQAVRAAIENNLYELWVKAATICSGTVYRNDELAWVKTDNSDWPNAIFRANFSVGDADKKAGMIAEQIRCGQMPNSWTVGPATAPENLRDILVSHGFRQYYQQCGMAADLTRTDNREEQPDDGGVVVRIKGLEQLKQWLAVSNECFKENVNLEVMARLLNQADSAFYAGRYQQKTVATLLAYFSAEVAGINFVSTLPAYRGKGMASILVRSALRETRERGYKYAVLQSSPMGESVYQRIGFKRYFDIYHYKGVLVRKV